MPESTALEALTAEMLGDIGKLHAQVEALKIELPEILGQVHAFIAEIQANAHAPQQTAQRELERFIRNEIKSIQASVDQVKRDALDRLSAEIFAAVNKGWSSAQARGDKTFDEATSRFKSALDESVKVVEARATQTLKGICIDLKNQIDEFSLEMTKSRWLPMFGACTAAGLVVGVLAVFILK